MGCINALRTAEIATEELREEETLLAFLDDTHVVVPCPDRTTTVYATLQEAMFSTTGILFIPGKTKVWNAAAVKRQVVACCSSLPRHTTHRSGVERIRVAHVLTMVESVGHAFWAFQTTSGRVWR